MGTKENEGHDAENYGHNNEPWAWQTQRTMGTKENEGHDVENYGHNNELLEWQRANGHDREQLA